MKCPFCGYEESKVIDSWLVMGEVEFPDEETAKNYTLPDSFAVKKEVTYDTHFHNSTMSVMRKEEIAQFIQSLSA